MQYSDTSGKSGLLQRCEMYTGLGDAGISGNSTLKAQFTALLNSAYHRVVSLILKAQGDWDFDDPNNTDYPIATTPLTTERDVTFPASLKVLKVKRVDITYDGTNYYQAQPLDSSVMGFGIGNDTEVDSHFSITEPRFDLIGNGLLVYPKATASQVAAGAAVRIEYITEIDEFTTSDSTQEPGIDEVWHPLIAMIASQDWAVTNAPTIAGNLSGFIAEQEKKMQDYYGSKQKDERLVIRPAYVDYE